MGCAEDKITSVLSCTKTETQSCPAMFIKHAVFGRILTVQQVSENQREGVKKKKSLKQISLRTSL